MQHNQKTELKKSARECWSFSDLLDYDYLLYLDESRPVEELTERDRGICQLSASKASESELARCWLARRREQEHGRLPGGCFADAQKYIGWGLAVLGLFLGFGYGAGVLQYSGREAINIPVAFGLLVGLPFVFSMVGLLVMALRLPVGRSQLLQRIWSGMGRLLARHIMSADQQRRMDAFLGAVVMRGQKYGSVPIWLTKQLWYRFALFFQLASLAAVIGGGLVHNLAFGWESTADVAPEQVHDIVQTVASPWHWIDGACPSVDNIAGSRIALNDGRGDNADADLKSWWPFLCFAMFFYAVLPKLALVVISHLAGRHALCRIKFNDAGSRRLFRRMTAPLLDADGGFMADPPLRHGVTHADADNRAARTPDMVYNALVPDDIAVLAHSDLAGMIRSSLRGDSGKVLDVKLDEDADAGVWSELPAGESVLVVQELWQPCTEEVLEYLRALRKSVGEQVLITVGLIKCSDGEYSSLYADWCYQLKAMRDPLLEVVQLDG
jgi:hypothetical protein